MSDPARILIVDDDVDTAELIKFSLSSAGYRVETALSGKEALACVAEGTFDLVLLDIMMPDLSGFDVMRRLTLESETAPAVVFFTARNRPEDQEVGKELGAVGYLLKPTTRGDLLDTVRNILHGADPGDANARV